MLNLAWDDFTFSMVILLRTFFGAGLALERTEKTRSLWPKGYPKMCFFFCDFHAHGNALVELLIAELAIAIYIALSKIVKYIAYHAISKII